MILFITGSFPYAPDGISDGAKYLYDALKRNTDESIIVLTSNLPEIRNCINDCHYSNFIYMDNWKLNLENIRKIKRILNNFKEIDTVHIEYPGTYYGKTFLASFIPYIIRKYSFSHKRRITIHLRLHEYTKARFLRKVAIIPMLKFSNYIYIPSLADRHKISMMCKKGKVKSTLIGSNIRVSNIINNREVTNTVSYFGSVYPGKGIERMLLLWKQLHCINPNISFKIIGEINTQPNSKFYDYHVKINELITSLNLNSVVTITGYLSEEEVSNEINKSKFAMLLFEDGLTLRRGSFLAYLAHGVPIITTDGDQEARALFKDCKGIFMTNNDSEVINYANLLVKMDYNELYSLRNENVELSKKFDWDEIAKDFLYSYKKEK